MNNISVAVARLGALPVIGLLIVLSPANAAERSVADLTTFTVVAPPPPPSLLTYRPPHIVAPEPTPAPPPSEPPRMTAAERLYMMGLMLRGMGTAMQPPPSTTTSCIRTPMGMNCTTQ